MAVHKVPQDVEADDKFIGPLSFKQFIFFGIAAISGYLIFFTLTRNLWFISIFLFFPFVVTGFLAFPWSREQPTELWLASRIRFLIKPRRRIWDQSGMKNLVNITVPKRELAVYSDGLSQHEVRDRFNALATMIDSRGWAIKNVASVPVDSDRLVAAPVAQSSQTAVLDQPDIMDESSSPIAKQFETMIVQSEQRHKSDALKLVEQARKQQSPSTTDSQNNPAKNQDFWFMHNQPISTDPSLATFQKTTVVKPGQSEALGAPAQQAPVPVLDEQALLERAHEKHRRDELQTTSRHERTILPQGQQPQIPMQPPIDPRPLPVTQAPNPDILNLAKNNDLNIDTIARQAKKNDDGEVVISLH